MPLVDDSIPFEVTGRFGRGACPAQAAAPGTGVIAGAGVRAVVEAAGIPNVLSKCIGSNNPHNLVKATFEALKSLKSPQEVAT